MHRQSVCAAPPPYDRKLILRKHVLHVVTHEFKFQTVPEFVSCKTVNPRYVLLDHVKCF